jgi:glyceraldehyde 3-phosphate dehydrogenase
VIPALSGKLKGHAQRVPVKTGSVTELVAILGKKVTVEEINAALKKATQGNKSFGYTDEEIVSSDVIGSHYGSVFDATQSGGGMTTSMTQLVRTLDKFAAL